MSNRKTSYENRDGRFYPDPVHERIKRPSVTTILSILNKPALPTWSAGMVADAAIEDMLTGAFADKLADQSAYRDELRGAPYRYTTNAALIGTHVHAVADAMAQDEDWPPLPSKLDEGFIIRHATQFNLWCETEQPTFLYTEVEVVNRTIDYGGRFDSFIRLPPTDKFPAGEVCMVDIKTGKAIYTEVALQLTAYDHSEQALLGGKLFKMPKADSLAVLLLHEDEYRFQRIKPSELYWDAFKAARTLWGWDQWMKANEWLEGVKKSEPRKDFVAKG